MNFTEVWKREVCPAVQLACLDLNFACFRVVTWWKLPYAKSMYFLFLRKTIRAYTTEGGSGLVLGWVEMFSRCKPMCVCPWVVQARVAVPRYLQPPSSAFCGAASCLRLFPGASESFWKPGTFCWTAPVAVTLGVRGGRKRDAILPAFVGSINLEICPLVVPWTTVTANLDPRPDVGQVFSWRLTACSGEPPIFTVKNKLLHSFWGFFRTAIRVRVNDSLLLSKRHERNFLAMRFSQGTDPSSAKPRGLQVEQGTLFCEALQMVFHSSVEFAVKHMRRYFAEIGYNRMFEVATYWCALLNCSFKMATASDQICTTDFTREICQCPWKIKLISPLASCPIQQVYRCSLFCFGSRKREGERRCFYFAATEQFASTAAL